MHKNERLGTYQVGKKKNLENAWKSLEKWFGVRESDLGGEKIEVSRERSRENEVRIAQNKYTDPQ